MNKKQAVARLGEIAATLSHDVEVAHREADDVLLAYVPQEVREAYELVRESTGRGFWYA